MNNQSAIDITSNNFTFRHWFGLIFTLFSLYLIGDVFYRWDAFRYHSTFSQYLPNIALAFILWSVLALLLSIVLWLPLKAVELACSHFGLKIRIAHFILYFSVVSIIVASVWAGKKIIWTDMETSLELKFKVMILISLTGVPIAWILRRRAASWLNAVQDRITPLVWFFAVCAVLSSLLVIITMSNDNTGKTASQNLKDTDISRDISETDKNRPNILFITFDALTARNMSVYGYGRNTTPFIDKWAHTASVFTKAEAGSNYTAATTPGMMTGKRTWTHRKYHNDLSAKPLMSSTENLALLMKEHGYHTSVFMANIIASVEALGISQDVDLAPPVTEFMQPASIEGIVEKYLFLLFGDKFSVYNWLGQDDFLFTLIVRRIPQDIFITEYPPELAFNKFLNVMDHSPEMPFFAWIHVLPPHDPQSPPPPFAGTFNPSGELREKSSQFAIRPEIEQHFSHDLPFPQEVTRKIMLLRDYYDEFILYCDAQLEAFYGELQKRDWMDNTVIIISADHGDSFEHDYFLHGKEHLYEQVTNIPLIIKEPDQTEGLVINDIVEQIDIPATILDLANIPVPSWMEGRSLMPYLRGNDLPDKNAISVYMFRNTTSEIITKGTIAVWDGDYKLIHYLDNNTSLLFNLENDPGELNNLVNIEHGTAQRLFAIVQDNLKRANEKIMKDTR